MESQEDRRDVLRAVADKELGERYGHLHLYSEMYRYAELVFRHSVDYALDKPGTYNPTDFRILLIRAGDFLEDLRKELNPLSQGGNGDLETYPDHTSLKDSYTKRLYTHDRSTNSDEWLSFLNKRRRGIFFGDLFNKGEESESYWRIADLSEICSRYLTEPWLHCSAIDRLLIHTMIYQKILSFGETFKLSFPKLCLWTGGLPDVYPPLDDYQANIKHGVPPKNGVFWWETPLWWILSISVCLWNPRTVWIIFSGLVGIGVAAVDGWGLGVLAAFGFYMLCVSHNLIIKWETNKEKCEMANLYNDICFVYQLMCCKPLSPLYLREKLLAISHKGVGWPVAIFPILDNAIARDPILWGTREQYFFTHEK